MSESTILVVEDDEDVRTLVSTTIAREGYRVAATASGESVTDDGDAAS